MSLSADQVRQVATLARLALDDADVGRYADELSTIMSMVDQLQAAEADGVEPMAHPLADMVQRLRPDAVTESDQRERFQSLAPAARDGVYLVPKVIE